MTTRWNRREFLQRSAALAAIGASASTLLEACGSSSSTGTGAVNELIGTPDKPVTLPIASDNAAIKDGLKPETGTLTILNYADYVAPDVIKAFEQQFNVAVTITTWNRQLANAALSLAGTWSAVTSAVISAPVVSPMWSPAGTGAG